MVMIELIADNQLAQRIGAHAASIRSSKDVVRLSDIERFLVDVTAQSAAPAGMPPWDQIGMFMTRLGQELGQALPKIRQAVKDGQVVHCKLNYSGCWDKLMSSGNSTTLACSSG
jgi:hypothetical protein